MNWKKYIDKRFIDNPDTLKNRDRIPTVCTECDHVGITIISNLKRQLKKLGTHLCWSCSARRTRLRRDKK